jgi:hypothetical protein
MSHNGRMNVTSEAELVSCFREIDRDEVELGPELTFPLALDSAVAWAVGPRAFLVFRDRPEAPPRGIVFHRNSGGLPDAAAMCEWCHVVRNSGRVKLMSARASEQRRVGLYLCADLGCVGRAHEPPGIDDLPEGLDGSERARRTLRRISEFASRRLF